VLAFVPIVGCADTDVGIDSAVANFLLTLFDDKKGLCLFFCLLGALVVVVDEVGIIVVVGSSSSSTSLFSSNVTEELPIVIGVFITTGLTVLDWVLALGALGCWAEVRQHIRTSPNGTMRDLGSISLDVEVIRDALLNVNHSITQTHTHTNRNKQKKTN